MCNLLTGPTQVAGTPVNCAKGTYPHQSPTAISHPQGGRGPPSGLEPSMDRNPPLGQSPYRLPGARPPTANPKGEGDPPTDLSQVWIGVHPWASHRTVFKGKPQKGKRILKSRSPTAISQPQGGGDPPLDLTETFIHVYIYIYIYISMCIYTYIYI